MLRCVPVSVFYEELLTITRGNCLVSDLLDA